MRTCIQSSSGKAFHLFNFVLPLLFPLVQVFKYKRCAWVFLYSNRASLTRFFCLPLAWCSFLYFFCLLCFCRLFLLLEKSFCMCAMSEMLCVSVPFSAGLPAFTVANVESIVEKFRSCATKLGSFPIWLCTQNCQSARALKLCPCCIPGSACSQCLLGRKRNAQVGADARHRKSSN